MMSTKLSQTQSFGILLGCLACLLLCACEVPREENGTPRLCGNGLIDEGEDCDGENLGGQTCEDLGYYEGDLACTRYCTFDVSECVGYCGDGELNGPEECDGEDFDGATCASFDYYGGTLECTENCIIDLSDCHEGHCGDGIVNGPEECDGEELDGQTCATLGFYGGGELSCSEECHFDKSRCMGGRCGDGIIDAVEDCDGDNLGNANCTSMGYYEGQLACSDDCSFDVSGCSGFCGDGVVQEEYGEICDDGVNDNVYGCSADCTSFAPAYCGDGIINGPEECDGDLLGGTTCRSLGFGGGTLGCADDCKFDVSECTPPWECGDTLIDTRDDREYETVLIGEQCWMAENLNVGIVIETNGLQDDHGAIEKYCYNNSDAMCDEFGGLYRWDQTMAYSEEEGSQGICPNGWRIPSDQDWKDLEIHLGMYPDIADTDNWRGTYEGTKLLTGGETGFDVLMGGMVVHGQSHNQISFGYFWTSTIGNTGNPWRRCFTSGASGYSPDTIGRWQSWGRNYALSIRCMKD